MTDRHSGYVVVLNRDIREDDAEAVINAIRMVKGVLSVEPVEGDVSGKLIAEMRRDRQWQKALFDLAGTGPGSGT